MHARGRKHQNKLVSNFLNATSLTKQGTFRLDLHHKAHFINEILCLFSIVVNRQKSSKTQDSDLESLSSTSSRDSDKRYKFVYIDLKKC